jgi:GGDEF domain-containing protein
VFKGTPIEVRRKQRALAYGFAAFVAVFAARLLSGNPADALSMLYGQTCSAGVASWNGAESAEHLIARADAALSDAKRAGRDRVRALRSPALHDCSGSLRAHPAKAT